jgi:hypothetical protein
MKKNNKDDGLLSVMILDAGNSITRAKIARRERGEIAFPQALNPLTEGDHISMLAWAGVSGPPRITCGSIANPMQLTQASSNMVSRCNESGLPGIYETVTATSSQSPWYER